MLQNAVPYSGTIEALAAAKVLPIVRTGTADQAVAQAGRLLRAGLTVVELTATIPNWTDALRRVRADHPQAVVGMGTITNADDACRALDLGADFLVSPYRCDAVRRLATERGSLFLEGGYTPGEIAAVAQHGPAKLFPAGTGGTAYLKMLLAVLPGARIVPTGGIALADVPQWLAAGALAVGVGSDLSTLDDPGHAVQEVLKCLTSS